jgi:peptidoglycan/LPS O-acetylase OafA/YrhL
MVKPEITRPVTIKPAAATLHLDYLDGWRGLAILFLLAGHFFPVPGINLGRFGVDLFFVLSGLLMSQLLFVKKVPFGLFYKRRISRIIPALYGFLALIVCIAALTGKPIDWAEVSTAALLSNDYLQGASGHAVMPFGHTWSLAVEEQAYILLSIIALASRRGWCRALHGMAFFICLFAVCGIAYWEMYSGSSKLEFELSYHAEIAAYGIFISAFFLLLLHNRKIPTMPLLCYPGLGLIALALRWWSEPLPVSMIFGVGALALLINLLAKAPQPIRSALAFYPLRKFGLWSFSIYLWQQPFYLAHYRDGMPGWLAVTLAVSAGITSYYLIEKPIRGYLNRGWAKAAPLSVAAGGAGRFRPNAQAEEGS